MDASRDGVTGVIASTPERSVPLAEHTQEKLGRFLRVAFEHDGSVEGVLQTVSVAGGRPSFGLLDRSSRRTIRCTVARERIAEALKAFDRRVVVTGRVKTNGLRDVLSVRMERVEAFPDDGDLPSVERVAGAFDLALGKSVGERLGRLPEAHRFVLVPRRWTVERTFGWLPRNRRLSKDDEDLAATTEAWVYEAMARLMVRRLAPEAA